MHEKSTQGFCKASSRVFRERARGRDSEGSRCLGRNKHGKDDKKGDKRDQFCVNRLSVSTLLWPCPVPDHCSLSCLLIKTPFLTIFLGEGLSALCAWKSKCQQPGWGTTSHRTICLRWQQLEKLACLHACVDEYIAA